jgi:aspartate kinase
MPRVQTAPHEGKTDISFTTNKDELQKIGPVLKAVAAEIGARGVTQTAGLAKLSVVGIGMRRIPVWPRNFSISPPKAA